MKHRGRLPSFKTMKMLEFYCVCNWSVKKPLNGRKAVSPGQTCTQFCYLTLEQAHQTRKYRNRAWLLCSLPSILGIYGGLFFEHHVITVDLNGNGVFFLYPHPVWNVGLSGPHQESYN